MNQHGPEAGGIVMGWLLRLVVTMGIISLVVFEIAAVVMAAVEADDAAGEVARASSVAYGASGSLEEAAAVAEQLAEDRDVALTSFEQDGAAVEVVVSTDAGTLLLHRLPGTEGLVTRSATRRFETGA